MLGVDGKWELIAVLDNLVKYMESKIDEGPIVLAGLSLLSLLPLPPVHQRSRS